ncbi:MAG: hypothetical protein M0Z30_01435 [Actinomycetota bacterium]|nr:hypothetical protein [Actinomycetota bacterium]
MAVRHPEYVLAGAVAVCLPMAPGLLDGQISATTAAERFLLALVVCWVLGSVLGWVVATYSDQARRAEVVRMIDESRHPSGVDTGPESDR